MAADGLEPGRHVTDRAREVDVTLSRQVARVMDDAVLLRHGNALEPGRKSL